MSVGERADQTVEWRVVPRAVQKAANLVLRLAALRVVPTALQKAGQMVAQWAE